MGDLLQRTIEEAPVLSELLSAIKTERKELFYYMIPNHIIGKWSSLG